MKRPKTTYSLPALVSTERVFIPTLSRIKHAPRETERGELDLDEALRRIPDED